MYALMMCMTVCGAALFAQTAGNFEKIETVFERSAQGGIR
jgi:hypothetical protein